MKGRNYIKKHALLALSVILFTLPARAQEVRITDGDNLKLKGTI